MNRKINRVESNDFDVSFTNQHNQLGFDQDRLNVQILRVHTTQKLRIISDVWNLQQTQLCRFFTKQYQPFPMQNFSIQQLIESINLKLIKCDGKIFFGQIVHKRKQGKGVTIYKQGKLYQGQYADNQKNGIGVEIYSNGNIYLGQFVNNKKHGKGKFFWFNMNTKSKQQQHNQYYDGDWWGGLPDGSGIHQKINGDLYTGTFKNGLKHGEGQEYYGNGDYYKGLYVNGLPEGFGEYTWKDGSFYKGDFKQGLRSGYGVWNLNRDSIQYYQGHYQNDKKSGYGVYEWESGWYYKGHFNQDYRHGFGELYDGNQLLYKGYWQHGQQTSTSTRQNLQQSNNSSTKSPFKNFRRSSIRSNSNKNDNFTSSRNQLLRSNPQGDYIGLNFKHQLNKNRPNSHSNLHRPILEKQMKKISKNISGASTIGTSISRPILRNSIQGNLYIPYKTIHR